MSPCVRFSKRIHIGSYAYHMKSGKVVEEIKRSRFVSLVGPMRDVGDERVVRLPFVMDEVVEGGLHHEMIAHMRRRGTYK